MSLQDDYTVRLSSFEGPLDLLLYLIRRAEVDIHDIPIVEITNQYLDAIGDIDGEATLDIDAAGEFLVMAATLVELKSRTLAPKQIADEEGAEAEQDEVEDPRHDLVRQLLAYQRFRSAAGSLEDRRAEYAARWPVRIRAGESEEAEDDEPTPLELDDVHAGDLFDAFERIMAAIDPARLGEHAVEYDDTPIGLHQEDLLDRLRRRDDGRLSLQDTFVGRTRGAMIGLFLAVLELARQRRIGFRQDADAIIHLELRPESDAEPAVGEVAAVEDEPDVAAD